LAYRACDATSCPGEPSKMAKADRRTTWQVDYNLACAYALRANCAKSDVDGAKNDREQVFVHLQQALGRPFSSQLTREGAENDPAFAELKNCKRFRQFLDLLPRERPGHHDDHLEPRIGEPVGH